MTIAEAIARVNEVKPNTYQQLIKIKWLSQLEWSIKREIVDVHEGSSEVEFNGFDENTPLETRLIAPEPYDEIYVRWLEAQIDYANGEMGRYNNSMAMFNAAMESFRSFYNREHLPLQKNKMKYF